MSLQPTDLHHGAILKHFKGNLYRFLYLAKRSEDASDVVVYQALYGEQGIWVRPAEEFFSTVTVNNVTMQRFALTDEAPIANKE
jgi:hypothetical protein